MSERRDLIEKILSECAEAGVPNAPAPWTGIRERALAGRRSTRRFRFAPRTKVGWALAIALMMGFGTVGFAATGWVDELFQSFVPEIEEANLGVQLNQKQTVDGVTFTLERAYADEDNIVIGYSVSGSETSSMPRISDGSSRNFKYVGGLGTGTDPTVTPKGDERFSDLAFFEPSKKLDLSNKRDFRLKLKENVVFEFSIAVRKVDVVEVGQTIEANGMPMTLQKVENSPARTEATLCFEPPRDRDLTWIPVVERPNVAESDVYTNDLLYSAKPEETIGCVEYDLFRSLYDEPGRHSLTVTRIDGQAPTAEEPRLMKLRKTIPGPWTFDFEIPER